MRRTDRGDNRNHHADVLMRTRIIGPRGLGDKAQIEWSDGNRRKAGLRPAKEEIVLVRTRGRHSGPSTSGASASRRESLAAAAALLAIDTRMLNAR